MANVTEQHDRPVGSGTPGSDGRRASDRIGGGLLSATVKRVAHTSAWLLAFRVSSMLHGLVFAIFISRHLGPEKFGVLSYAVSLAALAAPLSSLGLRDVAVREFKLQSFDAPQILGSLVALRICGAVIATIIVFAFASFYPVNHPDIAILCAILAGAALFNTLDSIVAYFIAIESPRPYVVRALVNLALFSLVKIYLIVFDYSVDAFILANAVQLVCHGGALWLAYRNSRKGKALFRVDFRLFWVYLRYSLPLLLAALSIEIYLKIDVVFLALMRGESEAGVYSVAARLSEAWYMLSAVVVVALFPRLLEIKQSSPQLYARRVQDVLDVLAAFATVVAASSFFWSGPLIGLLFGEAFAGAAAILAIHVWAGLFVAPRRQINAWLVAEKSLWSIALIHSVGAVMNICLNFILIPPFGGQGAAVATIISYGLPPFVVAIFVPKVRPITRMLALSIMWPRRLLDVVRR